MTQNKGVSIPFVKGHGDSRKSTEAIKKPKTRSVILSCADLSDGRALADKAQLTHALLLPILCTVASRQHATAHTPLRTNMESKRGAPAHSLTFWGLLSICKARILGTFPVKRAAPP